MAVFLVADDTMLPNHDDNDDDNDDDYSNDDTLFHNHDWYALTLWW